MTADGSRRLRLDRPLDLRDTLEPLVHGDSDPTILLRRDEVWRATRTPIGAATIHVRVAGAELDAEAWGPGAEWALDRVPSLVGEHDREPLRTDHPLVVALLARHPGLRIGRTDRVLEAIVPAICHHRVTSFEGSRAHRQVVDAYGEPAPGPERLGLVVPPEPRRLATASHQDLHPLGLERRRADIVRRAGARAASLEEIVGAGPREADRRLRSIEGIGSWASAIVRAEALGDPDAVPVGDEGSKHVVAWAFLHERNGTDAGMLELLEPFRGHRGRVLRLLRAAGVAPPRRG